MSDAENLAWEARRQVQAGAFDQIGDRYDEAFPHKDGQVAATGWLIDQLAPGDRVLDVGCGTGLPTDRQLAAAGLAVTGIDISESMLGRARRNVATADFHRLDVMDLDDRFGRFDAAVAFFSLLMLPRSEIGPALDRIRALLPADVPVAVAMVEADLDDVSIPFLGSTLRVSGYLREHLATVLEGHGLRVGEILDYAYEPASEGAPPEVQLFAYCRSV